MWKFCVDSSAAVWVAQRHGSDKACHVEAGVCVSKAQSKNGKIDKRTRILREAQSIRHSDGMSGVGGS